MTDVSALLDPIPSRDRRHVLEALRDEKVGGLLLLAAAALALALANFPVTSIAHAYERLIQFEFGPASLDLHLSVHAWVSDFLLAIFFFVVGVELKHEFVVGTLSNPRLAAVPIVGALGGMVTSAVIFLGINAGSPFASAWAIPISTDVAFALAVLALIGKRLPVALRAFLLTLAVVNDLGAISVIAIFYNAGLSIQWLSFAAIGIVGFWFVQRSDRVSFAIPISITLAAISWYAMFRSGIHATVAGVALGLCMRVVLRTGEKLPPSERVENVLRPFSAGVCVPLFAFVSTGIVIGNSDVVELMTNQLTIGILCGLVIGQPLGVTLFAFAAARLTGAQLNASLSWWDVAVVGTLASLGFTVALLVSDISLSSAADLANARFAIVLTNVVAIAVSALAISLRVRVLGRYTPNS